MRIGDSVLVIGPDTDGGKARVGQTGKVFYKVGDMERVAVIFDKTAALFKIKNLEETDVNRKS